MFVADLQSDLIQTAFDGSIRTNVRVVLSDKSFGQKSHDHRCENNGKTYRCKQLCLGYKLCLEEHTHKREYEIQRQSKQLSTQHREQAFDNART